MTKLKTTTNSAPVKQTGPQAGCTLAPISVLNPSAFPNENLGSEHDKEIKRQLNHAIRMLLSNYTSFDWHTFLSLAQNTTASPSERRSYFDSFTRKAVLERRLKQVIGADVSIPLFEII